MRRMRPGLVAVVLVGLVSLAGCVGSSGVAPSAGVFSAPRIRPGAHRGIHRIKHVVVIMQENRSFDSYFGTYPGADGLPRKDGQFTVCVPDPARGGCTKPHHASHELK